MPTKKDLIGQRFGKITVIKETSQRKNKSIVWECKCDCGNIIYLSTKELRSDGVIQCHNCGTNRQPQINIKENIIGKKYGHLTVLEASDRRTSEGILYKCQCDCENKTIVYRSKKSLERYENSSCGCAKLKYKKGDIINNRLILDSLQDNSIYHYYKVKCLLCGNIYKSTAWTLEKTHSCGCQKSIGEFNLSKILNDHNIPYIKEYHPNLQGVKKIRYDFAILDRNSKIIRLIEFDGEQHYSQNIKNSGWNTIEHYRYTKQHDLYKNKIAKQLNIPLVRIPYWERYNITLDMILGDQYLVKV